MIKYFCTLATLCSFHYSFAQMSAEDYEIIEKKCNKASLAVAESSYKKSVVLFETQRNSADFEELYKTMIDSKCDLYKPVFFRYWTEHKDMSDYAFEKYFLNKPENYAVFLKGLYADKYYDEFEMRDNSFVSLLKYLYTVSPKDFEDYMDKVFADTGTLGHNHYQVLSFLKQEKLTEKYREKLFGYARMKNAHFLDIITFLFFSLEDMKPMAGLLEETQDYWNTLDNFRRAGYYQLLKKYALTFKNTNPQFELDAEYHTKINFEKAIGDLRNKGAIGDNPTIYSYSEIHNYPKGELIPTLQKLEKENKIDIIRLPLSANEIEGFKREYHISNPDGILILSL